MRSDDYNGTQPSNEGCTSIDEQGTINCGVGTTLMNCNFLRNIKFLCVEQDSKPTSVNSIQI